MPNYYYKSGATNWNTVSSWDSPNPGTPATVVPTANDDVFFTVTSNNTCTVATTIGLCRNLTTTGWTGTITLNVDLRVHGNIVTSSGTIVNGIGWFTIQGQTPAVNKTMTSNGASFVNFQLGATSGPQAHTLTFIDTLNVTNIRHGLSTLVTTNGSSVNVSGSMTMENISLTWSGTTVYNLIGSGNGNFGMVGTSPAFGNTININKTGGGTITFLANVRLFGATFNYTAGTVDTTTNTSLFDLYGTNTVTTKNGINEITLNNVRMGNAVSLATTTLISNMKISGNLTVGSQAVKINTSNSSTVELDGNLFYNGIGNPGTSYFLGTSSITFKGATDTVIQGTSLLNTSALLIGINLIINKSSGRKVTMIPVAANSIKKIYLVPGETANVTNPMSITVTSGSLDADVGSTVVVGFANATYSTTLTLNTGSNTVTFPNLNIEALGNQLNIN